MQVYKGGDIVVHKAYGIDRIVTVANKGLPGQPCFYYLGERKTI